MDKIFNSTNSSLYNIYNPCYKGRNNSNYINSGCEDDSNIKTYLNDPTVRESWNIQGDKEWVPCNTGIYKQYLPGNGSYWIYPYLIKNNLRIVFVFILSGSTQEMLAHSYPL